MICSIRYKSSQRNELVRNLGTAENAIQAFYHCLEGKPVGSEEVKCYCFLYQLKQVHFDFSLYAFLILPLVPKSTSSIILSTSILLLLPSSTSTLLPISFSHILPIPSSHTLPPLHYLIDQITENRGDRPIPNSNQISSGYFILFCRDLESFK